MLIALAVSITAAACATAAINEVGSDTGSAVESVGDAVVAVVESPFHVIANNL